MLKGREQSRLTWQVLRQVLDGVVSEWEVRMYGVYILSSDYLCSNPTLPLNNYRNRKIFNVSVLPHQIVKMIKWTIKKMHVHEPSKVWVSKSMCPMSRGLWDSKLPVFSQDTVVGCDLANQWFSQGSVFASLLIFPQGNKMSAVVSSFTSVFQIEENM